MRRVLKYDMRAVARGWVAATLAMLGVAALGGMCLQILVQQIDVEEVTGFLGMTTTLSSMLGVFFTFMALAAYTLLNTIFILRRFYTHFFTDEGYLTFTLPLARHQLLSSKLIMGMIFELMTSLVVLLSMGLFSLIGTVGEWEVILNSELAEMLRELPGTLREVSGGLLPVFIVEVVIGLLALSATGLLMAYLSVTIGAVVAKRHKALAAIGIYYGFTVVLTFVLEWVFVLLLTTTPLEWLFATPARVAGVAGLAVLAIAALAVLCYLLILRLLNRRLNLS